MTLIIPYSHYYRVGGPPNVYTCILLGNLLTGAWRVPTSACARQASQRSGSNAIYFKWTPHPVIVTIRDHRDYIRVLLFFYYTTIAGWGPPRLYCLELGSSCSRSFGSFPLTVTVTTVGYRSYKNPLNEAPLRTVTGRNDPREAHDTSRVS